MSYLSQSQLASDSEFQARCNAVILDQSGIFKDDTRPDLKAMAQGVLRGGSPTIGPFIAQIANSPGFAEAVETPDGVDSSKVTDAQLLSATQSLYPAVAALFYDPTGKPIP